MPKQDKSGLDDINFEEEEEDEENDESENDENMFN